MQTGTWAPATVRYTAGAYSATIGTLHRTIILLAGTWTSAVPVATWASTPRHSAFLPGVWETRTIRFIWWFNHSLQPEGRIPFDDLETGIRKKWALTGKFISHFAMTFRISQLLRNEHCEIRNAKWSVIPKGLEPLTFRTGIWCSIQLSHGTIQSSEFWVLSSECRVMSSEFLS